MLLDIWIQQQNSHWKHKKWHRKGIQYQSITSTDQDLQFAQGKGYPQIAVTIT